MGKLVHFEIPSKDYEVSRKFYEELFGWEVKPVPEMNYAAISITGGIGGGFSNTYKPSTEAGIVLYFEVEDIPGTLTKAAELGGVEVQSKTAIGEGEMGYVGEFKDPDGNLIGLWSKA